MPFDLFWWEGLDGSRVLAHTFNNPVGGYNAEIGPRAIARDMAEFSRKVPPSREPSGLRLWRRRRRSDRGDDRTAASARQFPRAAEASFHQRRGVVRIRPREDAEQSRSAGLGRRDVSRASPRHADDPGPHQISSSPCRARADHGRDAVEHGDACSARRWRLRSSRTGASCSATNSTTSCPARASARSIRRRRPSWRRSFPRGSKVQDEQLDTIAGKLAGVRRENRHPRRQSGSVAATAASRLAKSPSERPAGRRGKRLDRRRFRARALCLGDSRDPAITARIGGKSAGWRTRSCAPKSARTARSQASSTSGRAGRSSRIVPTSFGRIATSRETGMPGTSRMTTSRSGEEITASRIEVVENGPHRAAIRIARRFKNSKIVQTVRLWANSARLEFKTDIDWHQRRILLKARFPLAIRSDHATFECAAGVIRRPTHRNTSWEEARFEVAAHRFVDLSEHGYGVALLNDGKYGHHALHNELGLSLLRSPVYPDPLADEGQAELHLRPLSAPGGLAERRRAGGSGGPEPAASGARRKGRRAVDLGCRCDRGPVARPCRLQAGRGRKRVDPADLRAGRRARQGQSCRSPRAGSSATRSISSRIGPAARTWRFCPFRSTAGASSGRRPRRKASRLDPEDFGWRTSW